MSVVGLGWVALYLFGLPARANRIKAGATRIGSVGLGMELALALACAWATGPNFLVPVIVVASFSFSFDARLQSQLGATCAPSSTRHTRPNCNPPSSPDSPILRRACAGPGRHVAPPPLMRRNGPPTVLLAHAHIHAPRRHCTPPAARPRPFATRSPHAASPTPPGSLPRQQPPPRR